MIDPPRILDDPRAGLRRSLLQAARKDAPPPPEARRQLLDALGLDLRVAASEAAPGPGRLRTSEWQPRPPLFSAVLAPQAGHPRRFAAGALAGAAAFAALLFGGGRAIEQPVEEPRAMVELRSHLPGVAGPERRAEASEPPPSLADRAPEARSALTGKGPRPVPEPASDAPVALAHVAPSVPVVAASPDQAPGVAAEVVVGGGPPAGSSEILPFGEGMSPPRLLEGAEPVYPRAAREARIEGTMLARCVITTTGALQGCRIVKSLPYLEQPVLEALAHRRYTPVLFQGRPVNVEYVIPLRFELH